MLILIALELHGTQGNVYLNITSFSGTRKGQVCTTLLSIRCHFHADLPHVS